VQYKTFLGFNVVRTLLVVFFFGSPQTLASRRRKSGLLLFILVFCLFVICQGQQLILLHFECIDSDQPKLRNTETFHNLCLLPCCLF
jgi:hypothetical protein